MNPSSSAAVPADAPAGSPPRGVAHLLAESRAQLQRLRPYAAREAQQRGAIIVDIRPESNRSVEGEVPGSLVLDRSVLEWRLDPSSAARVDVADYDLHVVLMCNEGYTSSLAAATLQGLGLHRATDMEGGYRAWRSSGLPTVLGSTESGSFVVG